MILETIVVGDMQVNCYVLASAKGGKAIVIDPGDQEAKIKKVLKAHALTCALVVNTHGHIDHIGADDAFGVAVYAHARDVALLKEPSANLSLFLSRAYRVKSPIYALEEAQTLTAEGLELQVIHLPGHTPGGIALLMKRPQDNIVFTGDSLFCGSVGRTDFPGADAGVLLHSIKEKLLSLPDDTVVYPGHGPASTIKEEKEHNPFLQ